MHNLNTYYEIEREISTREQEISKDIAALAKLEQEIMDKRDGAASPQEENRRRLDGVSDVSIENITTE